MKKLFVLLAFCATPALAQISVSPDATPARTVKAEAVAQPTPKKPAVVRQVAVTKKAEPAPSATPAPEKKSGGFFGFFRRLFGGGEKVEKAVPAKPSPTPAGHKPAAKATPKSSATPKPAPEPKPAATPKTEATPEPTATPKPVATPEPTPKPTATPKPSPTPKAKAKPSPVTEATPEIAPLSSAPAVDTDKIKQKALQDPKVKALHEKMISLLNDHPEGGEAYTAAALEYTGALFQKMRQLDPAHEEQITRKENATKRRLESGLPIVQ